MTENREIAFKDGIEHITAEMNLIRIMLAEKTAKMAERFESDKSSSFRGYGISPDEAFHWLKQADENPGVVAPENSGLTGIISKRLEESKQEGIYLPLVKLGQAFGLSRLEIKILLTCLLPEFYPGFSKVFGFLQDDAALQYPSIGFIMELYCKNQRERGFAWDIFHSGSKLRSWELLVPFNNDIQLPLLKKAYRIDERIVTFLMGSTRFDGRIEETAEISYPTGGSHGLNYKPAFENIVKSVMEGRECCLVTLAGNNIEGAYGFAADTAAKLGWNLVKVPLSFIFRQNEWDLKNINILLREAVLLPAVLLFYGDRSVQSESNVDHIPLLKLFARKGILIFFQGNISAGLSYTGEQGVNHIKLEFKYPKPVETVTLWKEAMEKHNVDWPPVFAEQLALMYPLSGKQIDIFFGKLKTCLNGEAEDAGYSLNLFRKIINDYTRQPLDELAKRVETVYDWNDLILHKTVIEHLKAFRNTIANRFTVYEKWGLGEKLPRGRGVTALFTGMPGTGKTMAAEVIARDLGINLYHVDLAGMVSKYVGETEKNIRKIFESARDANVLLFFDEADTLFGRRTEIKDSHDRYANLEVNYLLQRLEEHEGSVILATNMKKNMDEAFSRRIHFIIEFPLPSESQRRIILQKHLPAGVPGSANVDINFFAKHFELSGGDIKNAAVQAVFMAAEDSGQITMEHLLASFRREYLKLGKIFPDLKLNISHGTPHESSIKRRERKEAVRHGY